MAGRVSVPVPAGAFNLTLRTGRRVGMPAISPDFRRLLHFGRAVDVSRLIEEVGYLPRYSAAETIAHYVSHQNGRRIVPSLRHLAVGV